MSWNNYGLNEHDDTAQMQRFSGIFAARFQWRSEKERMIFETTVKNTLMWTDKSDKYASDFCSVTGYDRAEFNQLMSRMFYEWSEYVADYKKRNAIK
ncbi:hypothetical protein [Buttiauxella gaviniae]|uniref:hypothetical protein n=1 Tax=Buttiauxella gaviniae TaxID=82990 RepID=UPI0007E4CDBB|nr:hypothetical protein [Buttiauxella gaviniae]